jgi:hypothetical protein
MLSIPYRSADGTRAAIVTWECPEPGGACPACPVLGWDAHGRQWLRIEDWTEINYTGGYVIYSYADCDIKIDVSNPVSLAELARNYAGWNLVGSLTTEVAIDSIKGDCEITDVEPADPATDVWVFDVGLQEWRASENLIPFAAHWIEVSADCTLSF